MKVKRTIKTEVNSFMVGDIIKFKLDDGEKVQAMAVEQTDKGMLFVTVDCLKKEYPMNTTDTNEGGYEKSELRDKLNGEILDRFPSEIKDRMVAFDNGDFLRLPTEREIFGENPYGENIEGNVKQWKCMKNRRHRIAFRGHESGEWEWYWLQNPVENTASSFAAVSYNGGAACGNASNSHGVRPAFLLI